MALYYDAVSILTADAEQGSLKSRVYGSNASFKSKPAQLYALITETAKCDSFLKEVIDNAGLLAQEPKLSPLLSLFLLHDHFFSKTGIAASSGHTLRQSVERHKARLQAEFTKARLRRKCGSVEALKQKLVNEKNARSGNATEQPRWIRVNRLKARTETVLEEAFDDYEPASSLSEIIHSKPGAKLYWIDTNVSDLLALPHGTNLTKTEAYENGKIVLQDKASCFPAHLLLNAALSTTSLDQCRLGDIIDACAAPGNKTTHLASIIASHLPTSKSASKHKIFACERDVARFKILQSMISKGGAANVEVLPKQDFLSLEPLDPRFRKVKYLLLDPSCSGSGILGRKDVPVLTLPAAPPTHRPKGQSQNKDNSQSNKKRKFSHAASSDAAPPSPSPPMTAEYVPESIDNTRLQKLSNLQSLIIEHGFSFPSATHITYSTCSIHAEENENVVARVLRSEIAQRRHWKLLPRDRQVAGLRDWKYRGAQQPDTAGDSMREVHTLTEKECDACIRCYPGGEEGTMGFFVCCFVREEEDIGQAGASGNIKEIECPEDGGQEEWDEEWAGFSDED